MKMAENSVYKNIIASYFPSRNERADPTIIGEIDVARALWPNCQR